MVFGGAAEQVRVLVDPLPAVPSPFQAEARLHRYGTVVAVPAERVVPNDALADLDGIVEYVLGVPANVYNRDSGLVTGDIGQLLGAYKAVATPDMHVRPAQGRRVNAAKHATGFNVRKRNILNRKGLGEFGHHRSTDCVSHLGLHKHSLGIRET